MSTRRTSDSLSGEEVGRAANFYNEIPGNIISAFQRFDAANVRQNFIPAKLFQRNF